MKSDDQEDAQNQPPLNKQPNKEGRNREREEGASDEDALDCAAATATELARG